MQKESNDVWAQRYIALGWHIFASHRPIDGVCSCGKVDCTDNGKHPRTRRGFKESTNDAEKVAKIFGADAPPSNIAIRTGEVSRITILDIDVGPGKHGAETWAELVREHGEPPTLMAETGSGGLHLVFQYNSSLPTASNVLGPGVDCRNDNGYIIAAPSLHRSGGHYKWLNWGTTPLPLPAHLSKRKETRGRKAASDLFKGHYSLEQVEAMLSFVPADDRDLWRQVGIILGREFSCLDKAWELYNVWSEKWTGVKGRNHNETMKEAFYVLSQNAAERELSMGTLIQAAVRNGWAPASGIVPRNRFVFYGPGNNFIYRPTASFWIEGAVNAASSPVNEEGKIRKAADWLKQHALATSMTCDPSTAEDYIRGYDCQNGELTRVEGAAVYNSYRRSAIVLGDARLAKPYVEHVRRLFNKPGDADQFLNYMAHRVQKPWEKPRFALLIAGGQGVGKDTAIEMICPALGTWNVANIDPSAFESGFNEYAAATLIRISEAANLHEMTKWAFNERTKVLIAGSPDIAQINPKYGQKFFIRMFCGVVITTNHLTGGIYIPPDDRRYDVIDTATMEELDLVDEVKRREYFETLWEWFLAGGMTHIAAYLHERDLSKFSASNGQRRTEAHKSVVAVGLTSDQWLIDIISDLGDPEVLRADWIITRAVSNGEREMDVRRKIGSSIGRAGYFFLRNGGSKDGRWKHEGKWVTIYLKNGTAHPDAAAFKTILNKTPY